MTGSLVRPYEKRIIREYVQSAWTNLNVIESEKYHNELISKISQSKVLKKSSSSHSSRMIFRDPIKNNTPSIQNPHNMNAENESLSSSRSDINNNLLKTAGSLRRYSQGLKEQVHERIQAAMKVQQAIKDYERMQEKKRESFIEESHKISEKLSDIKQKLKFATMRSEVKTTEKVIAATRISRALGQVAEQAANVRLGHTVLHETQYLQKARKINELKIQKQQYIKTKQKEKREREEAKKKAQLEKLNEIMEEKKSKVEQIEKNLKLKEEKQKQVMQEVFFNKAYKK